MSAPDDLDPEELEFYELFGSLREQIFEMFGDLAGSILTRIEQREDEDVRLAQPDPTQVLESEATNLLQVLMRLLGLERQDDDTNE